MLFDSPPPSSAETAIPPRRLPSEGLAPDVAALAVACLLVGLLALAGALVAPGLQARPALLLRVLGLGLLFSGVGAGLLARWRWACSAVLGMLAYGAVAQLTQGWLQDDVLAAWLEAISGQSPHAFIALGAFADGLGPAWSVALCGACGWYLLRLSLPLWHAQLSAAPFVSPGPHPRPHPRNTSARPPARNG
jgi:hypothetical protein